ncbi:M91 family zinc metallopeptidase [Paraburkholderia humisilvae]|uniref:Uncharacterized protein n=2 Tax=Paraburkholderia humisilvae TaxID=627669 RepID=A0A6J5ECV9_9BURK|nr:hypothetical protein LMG29542_04851 [Paraburkholderia humisilvae]
MDTNSTSYPHIKIERDRGNSEFLIKTESALTKIGQTHSGNKMLEGLKSHAEKGKTVTIAHGTSESQLMPVLTDEQLKDSGLSDHDVSDPAYLQTAFRLGKKGEDRVKGVDKGVPVRFGWNPDTSAFAGRNESVERSKIRNDSEAALVLSKGMLLSEKLVKGEFPGEGLSSDKAFDRAEGGTLYDLRHPNEVTVRKISKEMHAKLPVVIKEKPVEPEARRASVQHPRRFSVADVGRRMSLRSERPVTPDLEDFVAAPRPARIDEEDSEANRSDGDS